MNSRREIGIFALSRAATPLTRRVLLPDVGALQRRTGSERDPHSQVQGREQIDRTLCLRSTREGVFRFGVQVQRIAAQRAGRLEGPARRERVANAEPCLEGIAADPPKPARFADLAVTER